LPASEATLDPRTPVVVAVGQTDQRPEDLTSARSPVSLLAQAALAARSDCGSDRLLDVVDTMAVVHILSHDYRDPAALVAEELGMHPRRTIATDDGGNYPQSLLNRACAEILAGSSGTWLIGGAETWRTSQAARAQGVDLGWAGQAPGVAPTEHLTNSLPLIHDGEWARGIVLPASTYALIENAHRAAAGWTIDEQRDRLAALYARFSEVAVANPHAWIRTPWSAAAIRESSPANRMVGFPYTKVMNANSAVEQAACFVVTSVDQARALGISSDRWVFPWSGSDAHEHWFVSHRWSLASAPAIGIAGRAALSLAGVGLDDLAHIDVYSCFPSAVHVAAKEIGLSTDRQLTVTGGLSFGGGPWNNYVSHSIATMVAVLRNDAGSLGLITANGGYLTKHAFGVYSTTPPSQPWRHDRPQAAIDALPSRSLAEVVDEAVTLESAVVMHDRASHPERATVSGLLADGRRAWGATSDAEAMAHITTEETSGAAGHIDATGGFRFN